MHEYTLKVLPCDSGRRLDLLLIEFSDKKKLGFSRTMVQKLIQDGKVRITNLNLINPELPPAKKYDATRKGGVKPKYKVKTDDEINIHIEEDTRDMLKAEEIPLDIIYEDEDLAVINKQSGLVVHPAPGNYEHTLVNALLYHFKALSSVNPLRPGIVHRLDKETSGALVIAKNNFTHLALAGQFSKHTIKRKYIALVKGKMEFDENIIELPIGRHPIRRKDMAVGYGQDAKYAKTYYRTLKRTKEFSLLELELFTGRTHQIRVHLAYLGHPVLGDTKYGKNKEFNRLALHAKLIGFMHPRAGKFVEFYCEAPDGFNKFFDKIRDNN
ncbi:MAG: RluA family pseudouridine synthase [Candidatus Omnitrophica bacterium]|nr:RluA family pseudouridine synthase [Candidatus Omnitrophota bacterium]